MSSGVRPGMVERWGGGEVVERWDEGRGVEGGSDKWVGRRKESYGEWKRRGGGVRERRWVGEGGELLWVGKRDS